MNKEHTLEELSPLDSFICRHGALVVLLIEKGIITKEEYTKAIDDMVKDVVERIKNEH